MLAGTSGDRPPDRALWPSAPHRAEIAGWTDWRRVATSGRRVALVSGAACPNRETPRGTQRVRAQSIVRPPAEDADLSEQRPFIREEDRDMARVETNVPV